MRYYNIKFSNTLMYENKASEVSEEINRNNYPQRKSPRADFHDYSGGDYFVTICTREKKCYFGYIRDSKMYFTKIGYYCQQQLEEISEHYPYAENLSYVVMPNHIHMILHINPHAVNEQLPETRTLLSVIIGGLKRAVSVYARRNNIDFEWQSRYHDHIIRNSHDGNKITEYVANNVGRWETDCFNLKK